MPGSEEGALQLARELLTQVDGKIDSLRDDVQQMRLEWAETQGQRLVERVRLMEEKVSDIQQWQAQRMGIAVAISAGISLAIALGGLALTTIAMFTGGN